MAHMAQDGSGHENGSGATRQDAGAEGPGRSAPKADSAHRENQRKYGGVAGGMVSRIGPIEINWPRTMGYYSGIALALGLELIEPEIALFIAAIPVLKALQRPTASPPRKFVSEFIDGASQPVGGTANTTFRYVGGEHPVRRAHEVFDELRGHERGATEVR